ncbi:MAG: hypothetical protein H0W17_04075, partial [Chloroflexi bacterium]|nr:hypothetical protein [Chloroflexota bacterium]
MASLVALILALAACTSVAPTPSVPESSSPRTSTAPPITPTPTPSPSPEPTPTPAPEIEVPLAVVTGYTNTRASISAVEVEAARTDDTIIQACELFTAVNPVPRCLESAEIVPHLLANPDQVALLPAGLVVPTVKVLPVDGADLFGDADARSMPYPFTTII